MVCVHSHGPQCDASRMPDPVWLATDQSTLVTSRGLWHPFNANRNPQFGAPRRKRLLFSENSSAVILHPYRAAWLWNRSMAANSTVLQLSDNAGQWGTIQLRTSWGEAAQPVLQLGSLQLGSSAPLWLSLGHQERQLCCSLWFHKGSPVS